MKRKSYDLQLILFIIISQLQLPQVSSLTDQNLQAPQFFIVTNTPAAALPQRTKEPPTEESKASVKPVETITLAIVKTITPPKINLVKTTIKTVHERNRNYIFVFNNIYETDIEKLFSPFAITITKSLETSILNQISTNFGLQPERFKNLKIQPNSEKRTSVSFTLTAGDTIFNSVQEADDTFQKNSKSLTISIQNGLETVVLEPLVKHCSWDEGSKATYDATCKVISTPANSALWALMIIPILVVILIIILVLLWFLKYKKPKKQTNVALNEMGYRKNVSHLGGPISNNNTVSGLSMANSTVRNQVYTTMGKNYGFSIENADFSPDSFDEVNLN